MKLLIFLLLIFVLLVFLLFFNLYKNSFKIVFLTKDVTLKNLLSDEDGHFSRFNSFDLLARNSISISDYKEKIKKTVSDFTNNHKNIIIKCIEKINNILIPQIDECWIDKSKLKNIPWKIGIINSKIYEEGLPHTRNDVIILPKSIINTSKQFIDTLLHEKLHVYQKLYPNDFNKYLDKNRFIKYKKYIDTDIPYRSNPDTDEWIYMIDNNIYISEYIKRPKKILDVKYKPINNSLHEHPREKSVYEILSKINY